MTNLVIGDDIILYKLVCILEDIVESLWRRRRNEREWEGRWEGRGEKSGEEDRYISGDYTLQLVRLALTTHLQMESLQPLPLPRPPAF